MPRYFRFWWGKLLATIFGSLIAGPIGAAFGLIIGHLFDIGWVYHANNYYSVAERNQIQQCFFSSTFIIMGYLAKADGRVSENEINHARKIMQRMHLSSAQQQEAMDYFKQGRDKEFNFNDLLNEFAEKCRRDEILCRLFIEIQLGTALSDSKIVKPQVQDILERICRQLGIPLHSFFAYKHYQTKQNYQHQRNSYQYQKQDYQRSYASTQPTELDNAYQLLGVSKNDCDVSVSRKSENDLSA